MSAYFVFIREKTLDQAELEIYRQKVAATFAGYTGKLLTTSYGRYEVLEGAATEGVIIAEFATMDEARAWYDSPAYKEVREHRFKGGIYRGLLVEGA
ncbi:MAG: DUF1330 domain-containing protein [Candidatus Obscuribacterales bacterium]|nr:DUF1330 domain-containing protein [Candidatus Obscuribacterales bacterium]